MLGKMAPGEVDVADEEGGEMDLLPVQLLLREENQPQKISMRKHLDAFVLLQPSRSCCHNLRRGGLGVEAVPKADATIPPLPSPGPQGTARCHV
jgi:hypothetical protein